MSRVPGEILSRVRFDASTRHGSVIDAIQVVTGAKTSSMAHRLYSRTMQRLPQYAEKVAMVKFPGKHQRPTPCLPPKDLHGFVTIMLKRQEWLAVTAVTRSGEGHVYIATSPFINGCKVGMWRGDMSSLRARYMTYYGHGVGIEAFHFDKCRDIEKAVHAHLRQFQLTGELYMPEAVAHARAFLTNASTQPK